MPSPEVRRGFLLHLAAEGMVPVLGGCAGALLGGPEGGVAGVAVGQVVEKAINFFCVKGLNFPKRRVRTGDPGIG